jgi:AraC-like DNA-binding protein
MNLAAERLQTPDVLIKEVAVELGFHDPFHFSRAFKSIFGLSPEAFRRLR